MKKQYGIKAYGRTARFATQEECIAFLLEWIANTDGAERDRADTALVNLLGGIPFTDTDAAHTREVAK